MIETIWLRKIEPLVFDSNALNHLIVENWTINVW